MLCDVFLFAAPSFRCAPAKLLVPITLHVLVAKYATTIGTSCKRAQALTEWSPEARYALLLLLQCWLLFWPGGPQACPVLLWTFQKNKNWGYILRVEG